MADAEDQDGEAIGIFIMPSEDGVPPRAILFTAPQMRKIEVADGVEAIALELSQGTVTWSRDLCAWISERGTAVPTVLGEAITARAKELGVEW